MSFWLRPYNYLKNACSYLRSLKTNLNMPLAASTAGESIKAGKEENASEKEVKKGLNNINKEWKWW